VLESLCIAAIAFKLLSKGSETKRDQKRLRLDRKRLTHAPLEVETQACGMRPKPQLFQYKKKRKQKCGFDEF
jgi:hypothetical protein